MDLAECASPACRQMMNDVNKQDRIMKRHLVFVISALALLLTSCAGTKNFVYLQDMEPGQKYPVDMKYEAVVMRDDRLRITVSSKSPELAIPFNIHGGSFRVGTDGSISTMQTGADMVEEGYRVDVDGNIDFPILGKLHVEGLTVTQVIDLIKTRIEEGNYMKNPLISVEFLNFRYTVMGAVSNTGTFNVEGDRVTLFEALAQAGGLTARARIDNVAVIREIGDDREMYVADLRTKDVFSSPCYYLQQNDIVYVEPKYMKKDAEDRGWQIGTTLLSVVTAVCSILWAINSFN